MMRALLLMMACSSGGAQVNITQMIGPSGGTVAAGDGSQVAIPMGALSQPANISISAVNAPAPAGTVLVGPAYNFGPDGTQFGTPVTITLAFDAGKIPAGKSASDILIYTAPSGSTSYLPLQTTVASNTVQTQTSHFTVYLPAVVSGNADLGSSGTCTPTCSPSSGGCTCTGSCNGHLYSLICMDSTSPFCYCEIDHATQSNAISGFSSCMQSNLPTIFNQCLPAL
jgi:hypothetical protein